MADITPITNLRGPAARITSVSAESIPAGQSAEVVMTGPDQNRAFAFKVPRGLPGVNAVENDTAVAEYVGAADSDTREALNATFARAFSLHRAAGDLSDLQAAVNAAAAQKVPLHLSGAYTISGTVNIPDSIRIIGMGGVTIAQTAPLTPILLADGIDDVHIENVTLVGLGTDFVNAETVYGATAIRFTGACERILIDHITVVGIAGAGVFVTTAATKSVTITNSRITGVGLPALGTANYSAGVVVQDGITDVTISGNDISQIAQGVAVGHGSKRILFTENRIHHTSEHGAYFATSDNYIIEENYFYNTGLLGFKIQNGKAGYTCKGARIAGNHLDSTGSNSIMITNAIASGTVFIENIVIEGNIIRASGDTGIRIDSARALIITNNLINGARFGMRFFKTAGLHATGNKILNTERTGLLLEDGTSLRIESTTILNAGIVGPEKVGLIVQGVVSGLALIDNDIDYDVAAHNDAVLFGAGTFTGVRVRGNYLRGANYGIRPSTALAGIIVWRDNMLVGGLGGSDAVPSFVPLLPNTTGQSLANVEAEVNKVKQILRDQRDAR